MSHFRKGSYEANLIDKVQGYLQGVVCEGTYPRKVIPSVVESFRREMMICLKCPCRCVNVFRLIRESLADAKKIVIEKMGGNGLAIVERILRRNTEKCCDMCASFDGFLSHLENGQEGAVYPCDLVVCIILKSFLEKLEVRSIDAPSMGAMEFEKLFA